jgi:hypothetical protein
MTCEREKNMKTSTHTRTGSHSRERGVKLPLALFHAPLPGEEVGLFSDRIEDLVEYEAIVHEFETLHDAECAG